MLKGYCSCLAILNCISLAHFEIVTAETGRDILVTCFSYFCNTDPDIVNYFSRTITAPCFYKFFRLLKRNLFVILEQYMQKCCHAACNTITCRTFITNTSEHFHNLDKWIVVSLELQFSQTKTLFAFTGNRFVQNEIRLLPIFLP